MMPYLFCLLVAGCTGDRQSDVVKPAPALPRETERELKALSVRNPEADHYSLYWVTNYMYVGSIEADGSTQAPVRVEMSAEAFVWRRLSDTNCMTYVTTDKTLAIVGTTGFLAWFDSKFTNIPPDFMRRIEAQQPLSRIQK